jgi:hypothetical protein
MTMTDPITPPPELVQQWIKQGVGRPPSTDYMTHFANCAAQWGADQELDACCEWLQLNYNYPLVNHPLRVTRRPKPPSLKEQALHELADVYDRDKIDDTTYDTIRAALEALPND